MAHGFRCGMQCTIDWLQSHSSHCMGVAKIFGLQRGREGGKSNDESVPISDS